MSPPADSRFRRYLFADQDLGELVASMRPKEGGILAEVADKLRAGDASGAEVALASVMLALPDEVTSWHHMLAAWLQLGKQKPERAQASLRRAAAHPSADSRTRLWAWRALRGLGASPDAPVVEGVVVEVPNAQGTDTLAAYTDGAVRYLAPPNLRFVWDAPDRRLAAQVKAVFDATAAALPACGEIADAPIAAGHVRHTLLTHAGPRGRDDLIAALDDASPMTPLFAAATALLEAVLALTGWART